MQIAQLSPEVARSSSGIVLGWSSSSSPSAENVLSRCLEDDASGVVGVSGGGVAEMGIGCFSEVEVTSTYSGVDSGTGVVERNGVAGVDPGGLLTVGNPSAA